ncbi:PilW family protein [Allohahella marinimesophila]|uniref:Type IV pilus assembly protein PilW n=1 Tax=Allohahella marinimesophila TaxID=1054972 RepID=A0ABP7NQE9_9GAMM
MMNYRQNGLSLVELMIAILVSSLLLTGVVQVMLAKKDTYTFQQAQSQVQENSRFSVSFLEDILEKTGFRQLPQTTKMFVFKQKGASTHCATFDPGQVIAASKTGMGICIRYQEVVSDDVDCTGAKIGNAANYDAAGYTEPVVERIYYNAATNELVCGRDGGTAYPLVSDIEDFSLRYGIDSNNDRVADKYVTAPANSDWKKIVSLRFDVLAVAPGNINTTPQVFRFPLDAAADTTAADARIYRVATQTIALKNIVL